MLPNERQKHATSLNVQLCLDLSPRYAAIKPNAILSIAAITPHYPISLCCNDNVPAAVGYAVVYLLRDDGEGVVEAQLNVCCV
jgi:hypothetical protein